VHKVIEAIAAAQAPDSPDKVMVGAYVNDIQERDFKRTPTAASASTPKSHWPRVSLDPEITLSGFKVVKPVMRITSNTCPTNFGDLAELHRASLCRSRSPGRSWQCRSRPSFPSC